MKPNMTHPSIIKISLAYFSTNKRKPIEIPHWSFCDNEKDANECADLVLAGIKQATSPSLWWFESNNEPLPCEGDLNIVTNWQGEALCIIETVAVKITPYNEISEQYANLEGEGDKSLKYWQQVHWDYYHRELAGTKFKPSPDMPIVCEQFKVVFKL